MKERSGPNNGSPARRNRLVRRQGAVVSAAGLALLIAAASALAITGDLTQPAGTSGCVSETGAGPCANGHALKGADTAAVTADGKNVYAVSQDSDALVRFTRNTTTGAITEP